MIEAQIEELFQRAVGLSGALGAQLSIIKGDQVIDLAAGLADIEGRIEMTPDTVMQIGSITKVFNAAIVLSLAEDGLLEIDAPVKRYLPLLKLPDEDASTRLTLRHLLSMSSGLDNGRYVYFGSGADALGEYVRHLDTLMMHHFAPGTCFGYSNAGTCIAGYAAATAASESWESLLRNRILDPAALGSAIVLDEDLPGKIVSAGHYETAGGERPMVVPPVFSARRSRGPSGASFGLATRDLARFGRLLANDGAADTGAYVLTAGSVRLMMQPQVQVPNRMYAQQWCLGPFANDWDGVKLWGHNGGTTTSMSSIHWIPALKGVIAFNVNTPSAFVDFSRLVLTDVLRAAFGCAKPVMSSERQSSEPLNERRYLGTYKSLGATLYVAGIERGALFARLVSERLPEELANNALVMEEPEQDLVLTQLGHDRFLISSRNGPDRLKGSMDTAFYGADDRGRATNVLDGVFPMRRSPEQF